MNAAFWLIPLVTFLIAFGGGYAMLRYEVGHQEAARRLRARWPIMAISIGSGAILFYAASRFVPSPWVDRAWAAFFWFFTLGIWYGLSVRFRQQREAGAVLLDLGRPRGQWVGGILGIVAAACGVAGLALSLHAGSPSGETLSSVANGIWMTSLGIYFVSQSWSGRRLCENGLWYWGMLLKWEVFEKYEWSSTALSIWTKKRRWFQLPMTLPIKPHQREAVAELLRQHVQVAK